MFYLYHHYDLDQLADLLAVLLARRERAHALEPDTIVVPNRGIGRWLQMQLAEGEGMAANLAMPLFARFVWQLLPRTLPDQPDSGEYERDRMRWHLYRLLPEIAKGNTAVAHYLAGEPRDIQRLQLADRLADVFDQYLIYRPQLLYAWEAGQIADTSPDDWQAHAWRALTDALGAEHRARLLHRFVETMDGAPDFGDARLPSALYCFGLDNLPPDYVKFLYALAKHVDVHFLLPNPCEGYWGDIQSRPARIDAPLDEEPAADELALEQAHPLLASLGRGTRDLLRVLYAEELQQIHEPELGDALAYKPPPCDSLLARVQTGIIHMSAPRAPDGTAADDVSVQLHACHGPLREVQVLHDQLLDLLSRNPELQPRDIVVMLADVDAYAPAIHGVFGTARGAHHLPYSLSDRARHASHPIVQSFQKLLDLPLSRWTASDILALAAVPAIMRRFGLDEAALQTARDWVEAAGVRWGFDAETRAAFGAGQNDQNTWRFALDRLLLGLAQSDEETLVAGVAPWSQLEGGSSAALGSLWHLLDQLRQWSERLSTPASAAAWQDQLNAMLDALLLPDATDAQEQAALDDLRGAIAVLGDATECLGDEPLSWEAVREAIGAGLAQPGDRQPLLAGGVTFCGLMALRAAPFRVVCLLGMNDGDFPRQERNRAFNILRLQPRLGDHSVRDDDRLLFLQTLMAARDVLYISYTGQDVSGGDSLAPSPLVGEWLDFLHRHYFAGQTRAAFETRLISRQPMHPFSARLFQSTPEQPRIFTFAQAWQPASRAGHRDRTSPTAFVDGTQASAPEADDAIELSQLRRFFDHPSQFFLRDRLQVAFESLDADIPDSEPWALDGLSGWQLRDQLLARAQRAGEAEVATAPTALWRARGVLPPPPLDVEPFAEHAERVNALLPIWQAWTKDGDKAGWLDIDLTLDGGYRLVGRIAGVWPDGPRLLRAGSLGMKHKLRAWIDYLAYRAAGHEGALRLVGLDQGKAVEYRASIDPKAARKHLTKLFRIFRNGQQQPLVFLPSLADSYLKVLHKRTADEALNKVNSKLGNSFRPSYEARDVYFAPLLLDGTPLGAEPGDTPFCELAEAICLPPFERIEAIESEA